MKIDLRNDRGILGSVKFVASKGEQPELSEDELIVETMRRRHTGTTPGAEETLQDSPNSSKPSKKKATPKKESESHIVRQLFLFILLLAVIAYYMYDRGILYSSIDMAKNYVFEKIGLEIEQEVEPEIFPIDTVTKGILSEDLFNELMPVTDDIAALADSIAALPPETLFVDSGNQYYSEYVSEDYLPISEEAIELSDDDIKIINNRSLLLMITDIVQNYPTEYGNGHLFLKRDGLTITAPRGGEWVSQMKATLDQFVLGSFDEDYSEGKAKVSSKFEIIMNAEQDFEAQILDEMRLLDVLAHPFNDYLKQIIIDLPRGTDDNPAKFMFSGTAQEIQYILSSWAETRCNFLLRSVDVDFEGDELTLTFGVIFFNYSS